MKQAIVLTSIMMMMLFAGCLENGFGEATDLGANAVSSKDLLPGVYYQFTHRGGDLQFQVDGDTFAHFDLFDGNDERLGHVKLGETGFSDQLTIEGAPGNYVIGITAFAVEPTHGESQHDPNETTPEPIFTIKSAGKNVEQFLALTPHVERVVLVDREFQSRGIFGEEVLVNQFFSPGDPLSVVERIELARAPTDLRILAAGSADELSLRLRGLGGILYELDTSYGATGPRLAGLGGEFYSANVRDNVVDVEIEAPNQEGSIILESWSYSRYGAAGDPGSRLRTLEYPADGVAFTYGKLPDAPVRVELSSKASKLYAWTQDIMPLEGGEDCAEGDPCSGARETTEPVTAYVAVYGPDDSKIGTFRVRSGERLEIPVSGGGSYVAFNQFGPVILGTDVAPRDFEMHPLETRSTLLGANAPGTATSYGQATGEVNVTGTPISVRLRDAQPDRSGELADFTPSECSGAGTLILQAGGETIGFGGDQMPSSMDYATLVLPSSGLTYIQDGFEGNCGQVALEVTSYLR